MSIRRDKPLFTQESFGIIAGPCTIENYEDLYIIASELKKRGINMFRGGAFKMRTSPYSFQGLGLEGLKIIKKVANELDMISVSEIVSEEDIAIMSEHVDILLIGTRNMQNYRLLQKLGKIPNPIILKRGMANTIEEWLLSAEHILYNGNKDVILCERGIRTFETATRNTLDISAIPLVKSLSKLPIIVDPSHSSGNRDLVTPLSWAAAAAGANGLIIEVHHQPERCICDGHQTINFEQLDKLLQPLETLTSLWK